MINKKIALLALCFCLNVQAVEACTTMIITPGASTDGSTYVTHSNDSGDCDPSIVYVPAKNHALGSLRPVYPAAIAWDELPEYDCVMSPRLVAAERAPGYKIAGKITKALGAIPQVPHTYAYIDSDYGVMNEKGLMLGECTNNAVLENLPIKKGQGIFYASELGRVALERCKTAKEAVRLMGSLIDKYGLYATGETILVADQKEGWVLEMQPVPSGKGGLWIAQRVPDGELFVAANQFRIRDIIPNNPDQIFNPQLPLQMEKLGWTAYNKETGHLDWLHSLKGVEDFHPYFALRRVWRALSLAAPSSNLPGHVEGPYTRAYPFSLRPDKPLTLDAIIAMYRDTYEGTEFDMTKTRDAGLFASPNRYSALSKQQRAISYKRSAYTWITQANAKLPGAICWMALAPARESTFVPLAVAPMPQGYENVNRKKFDSTKPWWNYVQVSELVQGKDSVMIGDVQLAAKKLEKDAQSLVKSNRSLGYKAFAKRLRENALETNKHWLETYGQLLAKYNSGNNTEYATAPTKPEPTLTKY